MRCSAGGGWIPLRASWSPCSPSGRVAKRGKAVSSKRLLTRRLLEPSLARRSAVPLARLCCCRLNRAWPRQPAGSDLSGDQLNDGRYAGDPGAIQDEQHVVSWRRNIQVDWRPHFQLISFRRGKLQLDHSLLGVERVCDRAQTDEDDPDDVVRVIYWDHEILTVGDRGGRRPDRGPRPVRKV